MFTKPIPFQDAIAALAKRGILPLSANSAQISGLPPALLDEAMFSSKVSDARVLQAIFDRVAAILHPEGAAPGQSMDTARAREEIRQLLKSIGYAPEAGKEGSIEDLTSQARLDLVVNQNVAMARGRGQWAADQNEDVLDMWPCQEFYRFAEPLGGPAAKRNWPVRWRAAGGRFFDRGAGDYPQGRMIARKDDPLWYALSRFSTPWAPFDFNSNMDLRDIDREEAVALGVITNRDLVKPQDAPSLALTAPLANLASFLVREVLDALGGRAQASGGMLTFGGAS